MDKLFISIYGKHIEEFIALKRKLGFKFIAGEIYLSQIDQMAETLGEESEGITREFAKRCYEKKPCETRLTSYTKVSFLAQFSRYLQDIGIPSFVPKLPPFPHSSFVPHIFSQLEVQAIFEACDRLRLTDFQRQTSLFCMPALLRLLYGTGIRISEARSLKIEDLDIEAQYLKVRDSKNGKERIVPLSDSLTQVCRDYLWYRKRLTGASQSEYLFVTLNGNKVGQSVGSWFRKCLAETDITNNTGGSPRIHDLRHTFAVTSLANMADQGIDMYVSLPILSNYLGHQSLKSTEYYVRLTANMFPQLVQQLDTICLDVFPKFRNYEAD
ncbi:integrase/recombinase XerD [Pedobacter sp. CG_S7]|uniref:tyrosine-type recombinase/integrase n=1 Tax=Pedobacter sp. CG_S7 TaxID=3143930 RepID=UPI003396F3F2